ncbi:MAG TPA: hypothetical protein VFH95_14870 [Candidatus Kapabacteria bacterium]|nr:hypothetical protein [Candidatus Kapabacteria bacterium]
MKYPEHTVSTPVTGAQAERIRNAMKAGTSITNPKYDATIRHILEAKFGSTKTTGMNDHPHKNGKQKPLHAD